MSFHVEYAALGVLLLACGAAGLAVVGRVFWRQDDGRDHFFSTSLSAVALVYAFCGGIFWTGKAAAGLSDAWGLGAGSAAAVAAVAASMAAWRLIGPNGAGGRAAGGR